MQVLVPMLHATAFPKDSVNTATSAVLEVRVATFGVHIAFMAFDSTDGLVIESRKWNCHSSDLNLICSIDQFQAKLLLFVNVVL